MRKNTLQDVINLVEEQEPPKYAADVPEDIQTPDEVISEQLGILRFFDGVPTKETVAKVYDNLDFMRGVEAFLNGIPATSVYAMLEGLIGEGVQPGDLAIFETLMDARSLFLTANSTTIYCMAELNVKNGPIVIEVPPRVLGPIDDAYFRYVADLIPEESTVNTYVFRHVDDQTPIPKMYNVQTTRTYRNLMFFRAMPADGEELVDTVKNIKDNFKMYPYNPDSDAKTDQVFVDLSNKQFNTIHANNLKFYEELNSVVQYEPATAFDPETVGIFAAIGIKKDYTFKPDTRMTAILEDAVSVGNATARALTFSPRKKEYYLYEGIRQWYSAFTKGVGCDFMNNGEMVLDNRTFFHYYATGITPAMVNPAVGTGSVYAIAACDAEENYLNGGNTYAINLPPNIPVNKFWSFMVYDGQTRSMLETDQRTAGLDSLSKDIEQNEDGSYTVWFAPTPPVGREGNWIQTMPNKSFNVILRLYGPTQDWFDKTWMPGDLELLKAEHNI